METLGFAVTGLGLWACAAQVILRRSPLRSALALIAALGLQAGLYVLLSAPFVAAMQVLVYAGAIMVLFVFVIMLLNLGPEQAPRPRQLGLGTLLGGLGVVALAGRLLAAALAGGRGPSPLPAVAERSVGTVRQVGELIYSDYLVAFEAVSVVLLVAVVGSVVLGFRRIS